MRTSCSKCAVMLGAACIAATVSSVPAFTQSHSVHVRDAGDIVRPRADLTVAGILRPYAPTTSVARARPDLPTNITVSDLYRPVLDAMLRLSPTFRRQTLRIAAAAHLTVSIRGLNHPMRESARARTRFVAGPSNRLDAVVELFAMSDHVELIAHELEHIIEQLDGIDLNERASHEASGVRHCEGGAFETTRAIRAGRTVAEEVRQGRR